MNKIIKLATRQSPMALWQAHFIKNKLQELNPHLKFELLELITSGDKNLEIPIANLGGKSLFVKELQQALLDSRADIAVHCVKDMSVMDCPGLTLAAICERDDPRDVFVSNRYTNIHDLPKQAVIGSSSPRRQALLKSLRPDLQIKSLRGNVGSRLRKLDNGEYDAMILAAAGLKRLNEEKRIKSYLEVTHFIPAIGQGALGIECRIGDHDISFLLKHLNHEPSSICVRAERAVNRRLNGDCFTPIGAYAHFSDDSNTEIILTAMVGSMDGQIILKDEIAGPFHQPESLGTQLAENLLAKGAGDLL